MALAIQGYLIDENMPERLPLSLNLPVVHATALGPSVSDSFLWNHAKLNAMVIITKDSDFSDRIMPVSPPPWVVRFRISNMRRAALLTLVAKVWPQIERLLPQNKLIDEYSDRIEAII